MALIKYFVTSLLVYFSFDISPLNAATIKAKFIDETPKIDDVTSVDFEIQATTVSNEEDIEKIFETYENQYLKNSNWLQEEELQKEAEETEKHSSSRKLSDTSSNEDLTSSNLYSSTIDPTADEIVDTVQNIIDGEIEHMGNRTDRTIVVVVTTNIFNVNNDSTDASKRQHSELSCGIPNMFKQETSTDPTLDMHNKITTDFFNNNISPMNSTPEINQDLIETADTTNDMSSTEKDHNRQDEYAKLDIRKLPESDEGFNKNNVNSDFNPDQMTGRQFPDASNDNLNDIFELKNMVPIRNTDYLDSGVLPNVPDTHAPDSSDSSLMEAIENILDTDVRKAFERDIPENRHVPLDISIEDNASNYSPLKNINEYVIEEIRPAGNSELENTRNGNENYKTAVGMEDDVKVTQRADGPEVSTMKFYETPTIAYKSGIVEPELATKKETLLLPFENSRNLEPDWIDEDCFSGESQTEADYTWFDRIYATHILPESVNFDATTEEPKLIAVTPSVALLDKVSTDTEHFDGTAYQREGSLIISNIPSTIDPLKETKIIDATITTELTTSETGDIDDSYHYSSTAEPSVEEMQIFDNNFQQPNDEENTLSTLSPDNPQQLHVPTDRETARRLRNTNEGDDPMRTGIVNRFSEIHYKIKAPDNPTELPIPTTMKPRIIPKVDVEDILNHPTNMIIDELLTYNETTDLRDIEFTYERDASFRDYRLAFAQSIKRAENHSQGIQVEDSTKGKKQYIGNIETVGMKRKQRQYILDIADEFQRNEEIRYEDMLLAYLEICTDMDLDEVPFTFLVLMNRFSALKNERNNVVSDMKLYMEKSMNPSSLHPLASDNDLEDIQSDLVGNNETEWNAQYVEPVVAFKGRRLYDPNELYKVVAKLNREWIAKKKASSAHKDLKDISTTTKRNADNVVRDGIKRDDETTEQHQIIKKSGVGTTVKPIKVVNAVSKKLSIEAAMNANRSFPDDDESEDDLQKQLEMFELMVEARKVDYEGLSDPNSSIHDAVNQVIESKVDVGLAENELGKSVLNKLNSEKDLKTDVQTRYMIAAGGVSSVALIVLLLLYSVFRFRKFERSILFVH